MVYQPLTVEDLMVWAEPLADRLRARVCDTVALLHSAGNGESIRLRCPGNFIGSGATPMTLPERWQVVLAQFRGRTRRH